MKTIRYAAALAASSLAACSGGTGQSIAPIAKAPTVAASATPVASATKRQVKLTFTIPAPKPGVHVVRHSLGRRSPDYVSPSTASATVTAVSTTAANQNANDATYSYDLTASSTLCTTSPTSSARTCTLSFALAADTYQITVATYDANNYELSADVETETVALDQPNTFAFYLLALVEGFYVQPQPNNDTHQTRDLPAVGTTVGSTVVASGSVPFSALDPDGNTIDQFAGLYGFWFGSGAGAFTVDVYDRGDPTTGCSGNNQCASATNDAGTSSDVSGSTNGATITYPNGGGPAPNGPFTSENESLTLNYYGGGGPGAGIVNWKNGTSPAGTQPYYVDVAIPRPNGDTAPLPPAGYTEPHAYIVPLFTYSTDGNGNQTTSSTGNTLYEWAAQAAAPDGEDETNGTSYAAYFNSPGTETCTDTNGIVAFTVGAPTYYPGYGAVFPVTAGNTTASCTLTLTDGIDTTIQVITVTAPTTQVTVPNPGSTYSPSPSVRSRKS